MISKHNLLSKRKALGIFSAGLDSWLSAILIKEQGFDVYLLHFVSPMFGYKGDELENIRLAIEEKGMKLIVYLVGDDYVDDVVKKPKHGVGSALNSCIDCHRYMLQRAKKIMNEIEAEFVFSGEVLGQRPMSQRREALDMVEKESELCGYLLRPLSAKLLPQTVAEQKGIIDRSKLLSIYGRGRSQQVKLAKDLDLCKFPQPSGGCKFTDKSTRSRFFSIKNINNDISWQDLELITIGRHFNLGDGYYLILARDFRECQELLKHKNKGAFVEAKNMGGTKGILINYGSDSFKDNEKKYRLSASIVARYTKIPEGHGNFVDIIFHEINGDKMDINIEPIDKNKVKKYLIV